MAQKEAQRISGAPPRYFESEIPVNAMLWVLSDGDISKVPQIEETEVGFCYDWYYNLRVRELNEMISAIKRMKDAKEG